MFEVGRGVGGGDVGSGNESEKWEVVMGMEYRDHVGGQTG